MLIQHRAKWCLEKIEIVSNSLFNLINRLFTSVLLAVVLFACQNMPENNQLEGVKSEYQAN